MNEKLNYLEKERYLFYFVIIKLIKGDLYGEYQVYYRR